MIKLTPIGYDFKEPFECIRLNSGSNEQLSLLCISNFDSFEVRFDKFLCVENREEFFDRYNGSLYSFEKMANTIWNYPISYSTVDQIDELLSTYEKTMVTKNTRLWVFLSRSNSIEVYTDSNPKIYKWQKVEHKQKNNTICALCGNGDLHSRLIILNYTSEEDGSSQRLYVHSMCLRSSTFAEITLHPEIEEEKEEIFI